MKQSLLLLVLMGIMTCCSDKHEKQTLHSVVLTSPSAIGANTRNSYSGVVQEAHEIALGFKTPGELVRVVVKEGQYIHKGQLIAMLDDADYKLGVESAKVQYEQMKKETERLEKLHNAKSLSDNDYDKAISGLQQLKVQLQANQNKLDYTRLYAPVNGYVKSVNFSLGEMVNVGTPVITLLDLNGLEVELNVPFALYKQRDHIKRIVCHFSGDTKYIPTMKLLSVIPQSDGTQLYKMRLAFTDTDAAKTVTAGMNVSVDVETKDSEADKKAFTLPMRAVFREKEKSYVWVMNADSTVSKKEIKLNGMDNKGKLIVTSGLNGDEQVVRAGVNSLSEGEKVTVLEQPSKTNVGGLL